MFEASANRTTERATPRLYQNRTHLSIAEDGAVIPFEAGLCYRLADLHATKDQVLVIKHII